MTSTSIVAPDCELARSTAITSSNMDQATGLAVVPIDDAARWDALLASHALGSAQASAGWGVYKSRLGHQVRRLAVVDPARTDGIIAMALAASHVRYGIRIVHIAAGPLFFVDSVSLAARALQALLRAVAPARRDVVVITPLLFRSAVTTLAMLSAGLRPVMSPGQHTLVLDLSASVETLRSNLRRSWRQRLAKAEANPDLSAVFATDHPSRSAAVSTFVGFYNDLRTRKQFRSPFSPTAARDIFVADARYVILEVRERDEPTAVFISHASRSVLTSFVVASSEAAKSNHANYFGYWTLINYAKSHGLREFDCGGIDPAGNSGVYDFKAGMTTDVVQIGPTWIHARSRILGVLASTVLAQY